MDIGAFIRCIYILMNVIQKGVHTYKLAGLCWDFLSEKNSDSRNEYSNSIETTYGGWKCHEDKREPKLGHILFLNLR